MRLNLETIIAVKDSADIVGMANRFGAKLTSAGPNLPPTTYVGKCLYHNKDHHFLIDGANQLFYCFETEQPIVGDILELYVAVFGKHRYPLTYDQVVEELASANNVDFSLTIPVQSNTINEAAQRYFSEQLSHNAVASDYLHERGFSEKTIQQWGLGFASDNYHGLVNELTSQGFSIEKIAGQGLAVSRVKQSLTVSDYYDFFKQRIMIPIKNRAGEIVGFAGRDITGKSEAKYLNTPGTTPFGKTLYNKRKILFGLSEALPAIRESAEVQIVEGYFDVIAAHQVGLKQTVALAGTTFTPEQAAILKKHTSKIIFYLDNDGSGINAAKKAAATAYSVGFNPQISLLQGEKDINDLLENHGPHAYTLVRSLPRYELVDFILKQSNPQTPDEKTATLEELATVMRLSPDIGRKIIWIQHVANRLHIDPRAVEEKYFEKLDQVRTNKYAAGYADPFRMRDVAEWYVVGLLTVPADFARTVIAQIPPSSSVFSPGLLEIYQLFIEQSNRPDPELPFGKIRSPNNTIDFIDELEIKKACAFLKRAYDDKRITHYPAEIVRRFRQPLKFNLKCSARILKSYLLHEQKDQLVTEMYEALARKDTTRVVEIKQSLEELLCPG